MRKHVETNIRKAVCIMANELHKYGYSLSVAFKKAWKRIKNTMTFRVVGTSAGNRQERLQFLKQIHKDDITVELRRDKNNQYDINAIQVLLHIKSLRRVTYIGYVPKALAAGLAKIMDAGIETSVNMLDIIGGYSYKENYGLLLNVEI